MNLQFSFLIFTSMIEENSQSTVKVVEAVKNIT